MTRKELIQLALRELRDGAEPIDVIDRLQNEHDCSPFEAEEIVEQALYEIELPENR